MTWNIPMSDDLGVQTDHGIPERIRTNGLMKCLHCGVDITEDNNSGWEHFTPDSKGRRTQKVCKDCDKKSQQSMNPNAPKLIPLTQYKRQAKEMKKGDSKIDYETIHSVNMNDNKCKRCGVKIPFIVKEGGYVIQDKNKFKLMDYNKIQNGLPCRRPSSI